LWRREQRRFGRFARFRYDAGSVFREKSRGVEPKGTRGVDEMKTKVRYSKGLRAVLYLVPPLGAGTQRSAPERGRDQAGEKQKMGRYQLALETHREMVDGRVEGLITRGYKG